MEKGSYLIAIVGGGGYVGKNIAKAFLRNGIGSKNTSISLLIVDQLISTETISQLSKVDSALKVQEKRSRLKYVNLDISNKSQVDQMFKDHRIDLVIHLASYGKLS